MQVSKTKIIYDGDYVDAIDKANSMVRFNSIETGVDWDWYRLTPGTKKGIILLGPVG